MPYYVELNSAGGNAVAPLHGVQVGSVPVTPLSIGGVVGSIGNKTFEVKDFSFDIEQVLNIGSQSSGAGAGKVTFNPFSINRKMDSASPLFFRNLVVGKHIGKIVLHLYRSASSSSQPSFTVELTDAVVKSKHPVRKPSGSGSLELTRIQFSFQKIEYTWKSGGVSAKDDWTQ